MGNRYFLVYIFTVLIIGLIIITLEIRNKQIEKIENFQDSTKKKNIKLVFQHLAGGGFFSTFNRLIEYLVYTPDNVIEIEYDVRASLERWMPYIAENEELFSKLFVPYKSEGLIEDTYTLSDIYKFGEIKNARELYNENRDKLQPYNVAFNKYIKLQPDLQKRLDDEIKNSIKLNNELIELRSLRTQNENIKNQYEAVKGQLNHLETFKSELSKSREEVVKIKSDYENKIEELNKKIEYLQLTPAKRKKIDVLNSKSENTLLSSTETKDGGSF